MSLAQAEVFEVATFYHHFDIVKEGEARAAGADGARLRRPVVRDGRRAGAAGAVAGAARHRRARDRRALHRPLRAGAGGRRSGRIRWRRPPAKPSRRPSRPGRRTHAPEGFIDLRRLPGAGRLRAAAAVHRRRARRRDVIKTHGGLGPARPRRRRLSGRPQVAHRARRAGAAPDGRQHRRRRARHLQGPRTTSSAIRTASSKAC